MKKILTSFYLISVLAFTLPANAQSTSWFLSGNTHALNIQHTILLSDESMIVAGALPDDLDSSFYQKYYFVVARISASGSVMWAQKSAIKGYTINGMNVFNNEIFLSYDYTNSDSVITYNQIMKMDINGNILKNISMYAGYYYWQYAQNKFIQLPNNNIVLLRSVYNRIEIQCFDTDLNLVWSRDDGDTTGSKNPGMNICLDNSGNLFICGKRINSLEVLSITPSGQLLFGKTYDDSTWASYLRAYNVFPVSDGFIIQGMIGLYGSSAFMAKTNLQGNIMWMKQLTDSENSSYNFAITNGKMLQDGQFIFCGSTNNGKNIIGEMNNGGNILWSKILEGSGGSYYTIAPPLSVIGDRLVTAYAKDIYPYGSGLALLSSSLQEFSSGDVCDYVSSNIVAEDASFGLVEHDVNGSSMADFPATYIAENTLMEDFMQGLNVMEICSNVGVASVASDATVTVFPVPASDKVTFHFGNYQTVESVMIYDVLGKQVLNETGITNPDYSVATAQFPAGVYSVAIHFGNKVINEKFVVQH